MDVMTAKVSLVFGAEAAVDDGSLFVALYHDCETHLELPGFFSICLFMRSTNSSEASWSMGYLI